MGRFEPQTRSMVERDVVADLRAALLRLPDDPDLASLVRDLRRDSPRFAELWETTPARPRGAQRKTLHHPVVGWMTLDCDKLTVNDGELQIVVFTAEPGTPDAEALALAVVDRAPADGRGAPRQHVGRTSVADGSRLHLVEAGQVVLVEDDVEHRHVLLEVGHRARAGDQQHPVVLREQPRQRDLARRSPRASRRRRTRARRRPGRPGRR